MCAADRGDLIFVLAWHRHGMSPSSQTRDEQAVSFECSSSMRDSKGQGRRGPGEEPRRHGWEEEKEETPGWP